MSTLIVATGNPGKLKEMQAYLQPLNWHLELKPDNLDIEETGSSFIENARLKARGVAAALGQWAIADDSGLQVDALGGAPGIYSARYAATDQACIDRLLQEMSGVKDRSAQFVCAIALANPAGTIVLETEGICQGEILTQPQGKEGFGYDPVFYLKEIGQTFGEMSAQQKEICSHRGIAFHQLMPILATLSLD